jgi:hypothetical protein
MPAGRPVGAGHFADVIAPERVNAMIERFVGALGGESDPRSATA